MLQTARVRLERDGAPTTHLETFAVVAAALNPLIDRTLIGVLRPVNDGRPDTEPDRPRQRTGRAVSTRRQ